MKLTKTRIENFPIPTNKPQEFYWDSETQGFGVRVTAAGVKSYIVRGSVNGKDRRFTIGRCGLLTCDEARKRAMTQRLAMHDGIDPQGERKRKAAQTETLRDVVNDYIQNKCTKHGELSANTKRDIERNLKTTFSDWADLPITNITRDACIKRFRQRSATAPTQANQAFRYLRALINWTREKHITNDGMYTIFPINPVTQIFKNGGQAQWNIEKPRTTRLPKDSIGKVWLMLQEYANNTDDHKNITRTSADLIAFLLLTGTRSSEAAQLTWNNVNLKAKLPTFHLAKTKNHNPVTFPLSTELHKILSRRYAERLKGSNYVFPAVCGKKGYISDPRDVLEKISEIAGVHIHPHALRRTFEDIAQLCQIDSDQRRQLLNHLASDVHAMSYANNPDPAILLPAVEKISQWIEAQTKVVE